MTPLKISDIFTDLPSVETGRLLLRKMALDDAEDMFQYASDPEVTRFTSWEPYQSVEEARAFLQARANDYAAGKVCNWGIVHKADGRFIGTAGFMWWQPDSASAEIGYAINRHYWGQGLMTEAVKVVLHFGFERMRLNRISASCDSLNVPSARVMQKVGMIHEGTMRESFVEDGEFRDMEHYAILRREWPPE